MKRLTEAIPNRLVNKYIWNSEDFKGKFEYFEDDPTIERFINQVRLFALDNIKEINRFINKLLINCFRANEWDQFKILSLDYHFSNYFIINTSSIEFPAPTGTNMKHYLPIDLCLCFDVNMDTYHNGHIETTRHVGFSVVTPSSFEFRKEQNEFEKHTLALTCISINKLAKILTNPLNVAKLIGEYINVINETIKKNLERNGLFMMVNLEKLYEGITTTKEAIDKYCIDNDLLFKPSPDFEDNLIKTAQYLAPDYVNQIVKNQEAYRTGKYYTIY